MEDERCCGTGTCLINAEGVCWCGQKWDGEKMCAPSLEAEPPTAPVTTDAPHSKPDAAPF
jgi:hypothetical protein